MQTDTLEVPGTPPAWVLDPSYRNEEEDRTPAITARFYLAPDPRKDPTGMPIVNAAGETPLVELVEIINRNDPKNSPSVNISTDIHRYKLYPREYRMFQQGIEVQAQGYPLKDFLGNNDLTAKLAIWHIHTVEQLASLADGPLQSCVGPGGIGWRTKAQAFLTARKDTGAAERLAAVNAQQAQMIAQMQAQMDAMQKAMASLQTRQGAEHAAEQTPDELDPAIPPRNKGGRPRKNPQE